MSGFPTLAAVLAVACSCLTVGGCAEGAVHGAQQSMAAAGLSQLDGQALTRVAAILQGALWDVVVDSDANRVDPEQLGCTGCGCSPS